ncbi:MAG: alpha/beta fold hydrolase [Phycisphaerales bacterium]|nr:alpha/beta fold hydrolase [Phycisphaerales bacterium]
MTDFEELTIPLPDGYPAYARFFPAIPCRGGVLYLHGIQSHCGWYESSAARLAGAGFAVLQPDRRGSGRNARDRGHADSCDQLLDDAFAALDVLTARTARESHHLLGVSWGGKLVVAMHARRPTSTESLILVTPGLFPRVGVSKTEMFRIGLSMVGAPHRLYDIPLNDPTLFTGIPERIQFLRHDPLQIHQATAAFYLASRRMDRVVQKLADAPPVPVHLLLAADERIIDNELTRAFVRDLQWPSVSITTYDRSRHTLEFDPDREHYLDDLVTWITNPRGYDRGQSELSGR